LDLVNSNYADPDKENLVRDIGKKIANLPNKPIFVIYVSEFMKVIKELPQQVYYLPANGKVALIGAVVDAAHTTYALSHANNPVPS
jgi:hypothetical protein